MSDLFGNHIVGFPTRRLICWPIDDFLQIVLALSFVIFGDNKIPAKFIIIKKKKKRKKKKNISHLIYIYDKQTNPL